VKDHERSIAERLLDNAKKDAGWHHSPSDSNKHLSIKNAEGTVIGHLYDDGTIKGTDEGGSGALRWLQQE